MVKSISDRLSINILCNEVIYSEQNTMPQVRILICGLIQKSNSQSTFFSRRNVRDPHGDTNSGRTGSGVEVNAIGCWHAVAETGLNSSSTLLVAVSTQDL